MEQNEKINLFGKISSLYKKLPDKKKYLEFVTALLSIPVLVTVIISNVNNLKTKENEAPEPTKIVQYIPVNLPNEEKEKPTPIPTHLPTAECKKEVGPVDISYPEENSSLTENPVTVVVSYTPGEFCAVVWSYRINEGPWSQFDDKSIALYNMTSGQKKLELRVKSIVTGQEKILTRIFEYISNQEEATQSSELSQ
jgi:hypothetical protein